MSGCAIEKRMSLAAGAAQVFPTNMVDPALQPFVEFVTWFERAGFCVGLTGTPNVFPYNFHLTRQGERFLDRTDNDHPLLPGAIERVRNRCPGLPDAVIEILADVDRCLDAFLFRPAIVLLGVAYELAIEHVADSLIAKGKLDAKIAEIGAARRLTAIEATIESLRPGSTIEAVSWRGATHRACVFAQLLRTRRNDAAHTSPTYGFDDRAETEEFIVSAHRHLPALWLLASV
ncbi:MAG: hypothetical protein ABI461_06460 [Polyangiaceae bacterium]